MTDTPASCINTGLMSVAGCAALLITVRQSAGSIFFPSIVYILKIRPFFLLKTRASKTARCHGLHFISSKWLFTSLFKPFQIAV